MKTTQLQIFPQAEPEYLRDNSSTFVGNLSLEIHRWFRYSAGFSGEWARELIHQESINGRKRVLDPFAGSGTVLIESESCNVESVGIEAHPFVSRVARTKLLWRADTDEFQKLAAKLAKTAKTIQPNIDDYPSLIYQCFDTKDLEQLDSLRQSWVNHQNDSDCSELSWLALISILRECSPVGTAQWQYILPNKRKARKLSPFDAFSLKVQAMSEDMVSRQTRKIKSKSSVIAGDARDCKGVKDGWADLIVTSPPYINNYDYADATRLEMSFMREITGYSDLQTHVRKHLVRSCTQHVSGLKVEFNEDPLLDPIKDELQKVYSALEIERLSHGGKKPYHIMVAAYFADLARVWKALRRVTADGALVCFVVGDSAPYGIYVPVDKWLGELALAAGFKSYSFEKTRDRNIKWKNRKHRVPLHEGRLWVNG